MEAKDFLEKNGFKLHDNLYSWINGKCTVNVYSEHGYYDIIMFAGNYGESGRMYSNDLNIYWLIGVLTYYGLIDKNYNQ